MDTENTKDATTGLSTSPPPDEPSAAAILTTATSKSSTASTHAAAKATGRKVRSAGTDDPNRDAPPQGTPQEWLEIVYQFVGDARRAGLNVRMLTIMEPKGDRNERDTPTIIFAIPGAVFCANCHHPNLGPAEGKCHNPKCPGIQ